MKCAGIALLGRAFAWLDRRGETLRKRESCVPLTPGVSAYVYVRPWIGIYIYVCCLNGDLSC